MESRKCHYIRLGRNWFSIDDLFETINIGGLNPETKQPFTGSDKKHIITRYRSMISQLRNNDNEETSSDSNITIENKLDDYIEIYDSQINELQSKQEELYSIIHTMQHNIDKLTYNIN